MANTLIDKGGEFYHGFTYSGHPVSCAVALENIRIIEEEKLVEKVANETGPYLADQLQELLGHPLVGEVRSRGLAAAVELVKDASTMAPLSENDEEIEGMCEVFRGYGLKHGIITRPIHWTIVMNPPLILEKKEIDFLLQKFRLALDEFAVYLQNR